MIKLAIVGTLALVIGLGILSFSNHLSIIPKSGKLELLGVILLISLWGFTRGMIVEKFRQKKEKTTQ